MNDEEFDTAHEEAMKLIKEEVREYLDNNDVLWDVRDAVITPSAKAEGFSRLRGRLLLATPNVWRRLLGIGYPGHLIRGPNVLVLLESKSQPARK